MVLKAYDQQLTTKQRILNTQGVFDQKAMEISKKPVQIAQKEIEAKRNCGYIRNTKHFIQEL